MIHSPARIMRKTTALAMATALVATTLLPVSAAEAGHRDHWKRYDSHVVYKHRKYRKHRHHNHGDALAAGVIGFALGAIIADQASRNYQQRVYVQPQPVYVQPRPVYVQPQPVYVQPQPVYRKPYSGHGQPRVITYEDSVPTSYEPWSPGWRAWCEDNYRSFNARTGTYRGFDGLDHFCVVK